MTEITLPICRRSRAGDRVLSLWRFGRCRSWPNAPLSRRISRRAIAAARSWRRSRVCARRSARWSPPAPSRPRIRRASALATSRASARQPADRRAVQPSRGARFRAWAQAAAAVLCARRGGRDREPRRPVRRRRPSRADRLVRARARAAVVDEPLRRTMRPWRAELTALEQRLRADLRPRDDTAARRSERRAHARTRTHSAASARSSRRASAGSSASSRCGLAEAMREVNVQRQEDLVRIDRNIGAMQSNTGREMLRQRSDLLNYVTVRTAARPQ